MPEELESQEPVQDEFIPQEPEQFDGDVSYDDDEDDKFFEDPNVDSDTPDQDAPKGELEGETAQTAEPGNEQTDLDRRLEFLEAENKSYREQQAQAQQQPVDVEKLNQIVSNPYEFDITPEFLESDKVSPEFKEFAKSDPEIFGHMKEMVKHYQSGSRDYQSQVDEAGTTLQQHRQQQAQQVYSEILEHNQHASDNDKVDVLRFYKGDGTGVTDEFQTALNDQNFSVTEQRKANAFGRDTLRYFAHMQPELNLFQNKGDVAAAQGKRQTVTQNQAKVQAAKVESKSTTPKGGSKKQQSEAEFNAEMGWT